MDRMAVGAAIATDALATNGRKIRDVPAMHQGQVASRIAGPRLSLTPAATGHRSERVLSLLLTLEALRAAPGALDPHKV